MNCTAKDFIIWFLGTFELKIQAGSTLCVAQGTSKFNDLYLVTSKKFGF